MYGTLTTPQEHFNGSRLPILSCTVQRSHRFGVFVVHRCPALQQVLDHVIEPVRRSKVESGVALLIELVDGGGVDLQDVHNDAERNKEENENEIHKPKAKG